MFSLVNLGVAAIVVAAGVVAYKLWKSGQAVTGASVVSGTETLIEDTATEVTPAIEAAIEKAVAEAVAKALAKT